MEETDMKRQPTDMLKRTYLRPDLKEAEAITEFGTLADHFSGGTSENTPEDEAMEINEDEDFSDVEIRAKRFNIWEYM